MKYYLLICIFCLVIFIFYNQYISEQFTPVNPIISRNLSGNAVCIKDDIELTDSSFKCKMNKKYSPVNIQVNIIKYQNFVPFTPLNSPTMTPSISMLRLNVAPNLSPSPFSPDDTKLIGSTTNIITGVTSLNNYKNLMKVLVYDGNFSLFDELPTPKIEKSSLENNTFLYLPSSVTNYIKYLKDLNLLQSFINVNKISKLSDIAEQFSSYLNGLLIPYIKPNTSNFKLLREIVVVFSNDKKNILNIQFNQNLIYTDSNNKEQNDFTSKNIMIKYDYLIINSVLDSNISLILPSINKYNSLLKSRQLIDDYDINDVINKINNATYNGILYVNFYYKLNGSDYPDFGFELVKRVSGNLIFMNYYDTSFIYFKNMCPDPANNFFYKGRCYSKCPVGYNSLGLACVLDSEKTTFQINKLFSPESDFCNQVCSNSSQNVNATDQIIQQACWCKTQSCDKCSEFGIKNCNC